MLREKRPPRRVQRPPQLDTYMSPRRVQTTKMTMAVNERPRSDEQGRRRNNRGGRGSRPGTCFFNKILILTLLFLYSVATSLLARALFLYSLFGRHVTTTLPLDNNEMLVTTPLIGVHIFDLAQGLERRSSGLVCFLFCFLYFFLYMPY
jgi:hypothetical protein